MKKANIVVLGAGLGGVSMVYDLKAELGSSQQVTLVSKTPSFHFTPSNPWVGVGWRTEKDITVELAPLMRKHGIDFVLGAAKKLRPEDNRIELEDGRLVDYDYLVIATGPELAFDEIEGFGPEGHTQSVCTLAHAEQANTAFEAFCADPGPIVVGAAQGASCYGPAYEYLMILEKELRTRKLRDRVPMTFVTAEPYIGHLGLGGVGDTKGMLEHELRDRSVRWITNAMVDRVEPGTMHIRELNDDGSEKKAHSLDFKYAMLLPAFRGIAALRGIEGLVNPRGFVIVDKHQRNPKYPNIFGIGVAIAIPPLEQTPVPTGVPKTGYMIESMVLATARNIKTLILGGEPTEQATWNAFCLADFGDRGVAFLAQPQNPPRNVNWAGEGMWVHLAKVAFEKYFLRKVRKGITETYYENAIMKMLAMHKLKS
ncbi:NAD(P)/FAD-dependent oxidoreductase [Hoeflea olei]|uniref:Sulfide-quinone reductase n=1 Tax=Hoeflea olei TaxID=1480615 RepID=A0A1C1YQJ7_9HYPH|nr:FAD-dependent oxidoreductase [Hoeflea olei]OCW55754.1 pyridine nucleotide-disulfide oxidoreductase [Hoeflea olei]